MTTDMGKGVMETGMVESEMVGSAGAYDMLMALVMRDDCRGKGSRRR